MGIEQSPFELTSSGFGTISCIGGTGRNLDGYQIRPLDVLYLTMAVQHEDSRHPASTCWCMINRFCGHYRYGTLNTLKREVENFSQTVNPAWAWIPGPPSMQVGNDDNGIPGPPSSVGRSNALRDLHNGKPSTDSSRQRDRAQRIEDMKRIAEGDVALWRGIPENTRSCVYSICTGRVFNYMSGWDDFASYSDRDEGITARGVEIVNLYSLPESERRSRLSSITTQRGRTASGRGRIPVRFEEGGEWYWYNTVGDYGRVVVYSPGNHGLTPNSDTAPENHFESGRTTRRRTGQSSSTRTTGGSSTTPGQNVSSATDTWRVLGYSEIIEELRNWSEDEIEELSATYGGKRVRL